MPAFGSPLSGLANDRKLTDEEFVHAGELLRLLYELAPNEKKFYIKVAKEVAEKIKKMKQRHHSPTIRNPI